MNQETFKKAQELTELISTTSLAIEQIEKLFELESVNVNNREYHDGIPNLVVARRSDVGITALLHREYGNKELLTAILKELDRQLLAFEADFANL